jgi:thiol-disulfide isomerase/thioredoxin
MAMLQLAETVDPEILGVGNEKPEVREGRRQKAIKYYRKALPDLGDLDKGVWVNRANMSIKRLEQLQVGLVAPPITGKNLKGKEMSLADYKGKVIVLDFWGSSCAPCRSTLPMLKKVAEKYADKGVVFLGVMREENLNDALKAVAEEKVPWPNWVDYYDNNGQSPILQSWGVFGVPAIFVIDREGKFRTTLGSVHSFLVKAIEDSLAEKPTSPK